MAAQFLASHGIDLDTELSTTQFGSSTDSPSRDPHQHVTSITNARLPSKPSDTLWDINIQSGFVASVTPSRPETALPATDETILNARSNLVTPSLCQPHIHLDKSFLLHDPTTSHLSPSQGTFSEAISLTNSAKAHFQERDLLRRGRKLIRDSVAWGVTSLRAFVEVDEIVELKCVRAGVRLKHDFAHVCDVQICAFAQLALFDPETGPRRRSLFEQAISLDGVDVAGSTPYVEPDDECARKNIEYAIRAAMEQDTHLDFHLDYNLDASKEPLVWNVIARLRSQAWGRGAREGSRNTVCLAHCTRLCLLPPSSLSELSDQIHSADLPITFVGLPTSDLFILGRDSQDEPARPRSDPPKAIPRGTLPLPRLHKTHNLPTALATNNISNAFTPAGSLDPLSLASLGVSLYHAGTRQDADFLFECVSTRAQNAIRAGAGGFDHGEASTLEIKAGQRADLVIFGDLDTPGSDRAAEADDEAVVEEDGVVQPREVAHVVYCPEPSRTTVSRGKLVSKRRVQVEGI